VEGHTIPPDTLTLHVGTRGSLHCCKMLETICQDTRQHEFNNRGTMAGASDLEGRLFTFRSCYS
jgi:hypothetical protein